MNAISVFARILNEYLMLDERCDTIDGMKPKTWFKEHFQEKQFVEIFLSKENKSYQVHISNITIETYPQS